MSNTVSRENYIESEMKKWKEKYEVPMEQEFSLKAMFGMQHQFEITPDDHVKTKKDLIETIQRILNSLRLKPIMKEQENKFDILLKADDYTQVIQITEMLGEMLKDTSIKRRVSKTDGEIQTHNARLRIVKGDAESSRGLRADYEFKVNKGKYSSR